MGGSDSFNTKARDIGVSLVGVLLLGYLYGHYDWQTLLSLFLSMGLYFGLLTTYWKKKGTSACWYNWMLTGMGYSLALLPFAFVTGHWIGFGLRTILVTLLITLWSEKIGNAVQEELGRGFITTVTLPLLLI